MKLLSTLFLLSTLGCHSVKQVEPAKQDTNEAHYVREHHCKGFWRHEAYSSFNNSKNAVETRSGFAWYQCPDVSQPLLVSDDEFAGGRP